MAGALADPVGAALRARPGSDGDEPEKPALERQATVRSLDVAAKALKAGPEAKAMRA